MPAQRRVASRAMIEVALLFLPSIPAYLWIWPAVAGTPWEFRFQVLVYLYVLGGTLVIGLRRWSLGQLGVVPRGIGLSLASAVALLGGRYLIIASIHWGTSPLAYSPLGLLGQAAYYLGLVGLTEELLFRGLIYRVLEDWSGARAAIVGSGVAFGLWHVFGQGPAAGAATLVIGLLYALLRWRAGGIVRLIVLHGLWDLQNVLFISESQVNIQGKGRS